MPFPRCHLRFPVLPLLLGAVLSITARTAGQSGTAAYQSGTAAYNVLRSFDAVAFNSQVGYVDAATDVVKGNDGNFYGTTYYGGASNNGTVYRLTPAGAVTVLHEFSALQNVDGNGFGTNDDGAHPDVALVQGNDGNLYGVTAAGGNKAGTFFKITSDGTLTTLYKLQSDEVIIPVSRLVPSRDGNIYAVSDYRAADDGSGFNGALSRFTPNGVLTVLHTFGPADANGNFGADGGEPDGLVQGTDGNFYGTTYLGGSHQDGTFYQLTPDGVLTTLHNFGDSDQDGYQPTGALALGNDGNIYGTTDGGTNNNGTFFQATTDGTVTTLYTFSAASQGSVNTDGKYPNGGVVRGSDGDFYGATSRGGANNTGTIFKVTPTGTFSVLHTFDALSNVDSHYDGTNADGADCPAVLAEGDPGVFYGVTTNGGTNASGTLFQLDVRGVHPDFFAGEAALSDGVYYLALPDGNPFGYYSYLSDPRYLYHFDLGYEYVFNAADGNSGVYLYDFKSSTFFYTSPTFPFPYLYDFTLDAVLYYYPDPKNPGHYNTDGTRYFYNFKTRKIITK